MTDKANNRSQDDMHPRIKELSELLDAVHRLSNTRCSDELYGTFADIVSKKLNADAIAVFNFNQEINSFSLVYNQGFKVWKDELKSGGGLLSRMRKNGLRPMENFDDLPEVKSFFREKKTKSQKSVTWALLNMKENVIGLMALNKPLTDISKNEFCLDFLKRICRHAAVSINSCLVHERHK